MIDGRNRWLVSGGIGSGKSTVRVMLDDLGFETIDADSIGHQVLTDEGVIAEVVENWPSVVVDGEVDRSALGRIVFSDSGELRKLEKITHPHIFGRIQSLVQGISQMVFVEIPLLDHGLGDEWTRLIVDCDDSIRLRRLLVKGLDETVARLRMASQPTRGEWLSRADVVIPNNGNHADLRRAIDRLLESL